MESVLEPGAKSSLQVVHSVIPAMGEESFKIRELLHHWVVLYSTDLFFLCGLLYPFPGFLIWEIFQDLKAIFA